MYEEMICGDGHLGAAADTRINTAGSATIAIEPDPRVPATAGTAEYVNETVSDIIGINELTDSIIMGILTGFNATEIQWYGSIPIALIPTRSVDWRWQHDGLWSETTQGYRKAPADKYVISSPNPGRHIAFRGVMRRVAGLWSLKRLALVSWGSFVELFGLPRTIVHVPDSWSNNTAKLEAILNGLRLMGSEGYGVLSDEVKTQLQGSQGTGGTDAHQRFMVWLDAQMSKGIMNQTLTLDTAEATGTLATAGVHDKIRLMVARKDLEYVSWVIRRDLVRPIVKYGIGPEAPLPLVTATLRDPAEELADLQVADKRLELAERARELGLPVDDVHVREVTGIPEVSGEQLAE
jgi:phage gp29-like protein